jgi:DNA-binding response OmpR family regulator
MSGPAERTLTAAEQGELRHELRTPFNHILGYAEMLLESAEEDGLQALVPGLTRLLDDARELLAAVNAGLSAERLVRHDELEALGRRVEEQAQPLAAQVEALVGLARKGGHEAALGDLERIRLSVGALTALTGGRMLLAPVAAPVGEQRATARESSSEKAILSPGRVLVVDDNETNRDLLCRRLEREGLTPTPARDGREALGLLHRSGFDLVLLDIVMPGVDGYEVLHAIKATPALRDIPVVMISALDELQSVVRCIEMGAEDYLPKPFDPVLLRARVGACLEKKRLRDRELEYLRGVGTLEEAASAVESGRFEAAKLDAVAGRDDELGRLARVFQHMATEVQARERRLKEQVAQLKIEIDMVKLTQQVQEVTEAPVFDSLKGARERLKQKGRREKEG